MNKQDKNIDINDGRNVEEMLEKINSFPEIVN